MSQAEAQTPLPIMMAQMGQAARNASRTLALADTATKNTALHETAQALLKDQEAILAANRRDLEAAAALSQAKQDRLLLTPERLHGIAQGLEAIIALEDPVGARMASWERPNGLVIERCRVPLGVLGIIYESRPNVTADAGALCLKAGNAALLRSGSDSFHSSAAIYGCLRQGLRAAGLPLDSIQHVPTRDRAAVGEILTGLNGTIDVIVPRGGRSLVERVQKEAHIPVFGHLEGICHIFVDAQADLDMACQVVVNAKMRRTGICGAAETLLIHKACLDTHLKPLCENLKQSGCEVRADETARQHLPQLAPATEDDWHTEYLDAVISLKVVAGLDEAMDHIACYGSGHTESIITTNPATAERFLREVDSAIVMHNTSTQFADGGEFGMGAEIGISTAKFHARGPVGLEQLTSFKYVVRGDGHTRP